MDAIIGFAIFGTTVSFLMDGGKRVYWVYRVFSKIKLAVSETD